MMSQTEMESFLEKLYQRYAERVRKIELIEVLRSEIPYFPYIFGMRIAHQIAVGLLDAYMDSFGEALVLTKDGASRFRFVQGFWKEQRDNLDFYIKLISLMNDYASPYRLDFEQEWDKAANRFTRDFLTNFGKADGSINWEKLVRFNSGKEKVAWIASENLPV